MLMKTVIQRSDMTYKEVLLKGQNELKEAGIFEYESDGVILFEYATGLGRMEINFKRDEVIPDESRINFENAIQKRMTHIPVQHITGIQNFMGYDFIVNENVLVPRFDTEILVDKIFCWIKQSYVKREINILDVCTGSGCIIISLLLMIDSRLNINAKGTATDISDEAIIIAGQNAKKHKVDNLTTVNTDLVNGIDKSYDVIVSNPPYIETKVIEELSTEVKDHEPRLALDGGEDGLIFYRRLAIEAVPKLNDGGLMAVEIGYNQGNAVKELFENAGLCDVNVIKDFAGLDRVVIGIKEETKCLTN